MRALVIEDDFLHSTVLCQILAKLKVDVDSASDTIQAYDFFDRESYDFIFCDICLPHGGDGFEVMSRMKALDSESSTLFIGMSGFGQDGVDYLCNTIGIENFLFKPFVEQEIAEILSLQIEVELPEKPRSQLFDSDSCRRLQRLVGLEFEPLLAQFWAQMRSFESEINDLLIFDDYERARAQVHQLKSNARLFGAIELSDRLLELETLLKHKSPSAVDKVLQVRRSFSDVGQVMRTWAQSSVGQVIPE